VDGSSDGCVVFGFPVGLYDGTAEDALGPIERVLVGVLEGKGFDIGVMPTVGSKLDIIDGSSVIITILGLLLRQMEERCVGVMEGSVVELDDEDMAGIKDGVGDGFDDGLQVTIIIGSMDGTDEGTVVGS